VSLTDGWIGPRRELRAYLTFDRGLSQSRVSNGSLGGRIVRTFSSIPIGITSSSTVTCVYHGLSAWHSTDHPLERHALRSASKNSQRTTASRCT